MPRSLMLECGPGRFGAANPAKNIRELARSVRDTYGLELEVLVYDRDPRLAHANNNIGGSYTATDDIKGLCRSLNDGGLPFNLALNGSPDYGSHNGLYNTEERFLEAMLESGTRNNVTNSVTIADNGLLPEIRQKYPGLSVIASCISAAYEPNLEYFRADSGVSYGSALFFVEYYRHLYSLYDMVVPIPQLSTPGFMGALGLPLSVLSSKTIMFLNLGCGCRAIGQCIEHYRTGRAETTKPGMPEIPEEYCAKPEDNFVGWKNCRSSVSAHELMYRFGDLRALLDMGIAKYKIPTRTHDSDRISDFLFRFMTKGPAPEAFPENPAAWGYLPTDIKLSFLQSYPRSVHVALHNYPWPVFDGPFDDAYIGHTAHIIWNDLHAKALNIHRLSRKHSLKRGVIHHQKRKGSLY